MKTMIIKIEKERKTEDDTVSPDINYRAGTQKKTMQS
jgi:hypothetical protein